MKVKGRTLVTKNLENRIADVGIGDLDSLIPRALDQKAVFSACHDIR